MLTKEQLAIWNGASDAEREEATKLAQHTMGNLIHYSSKRQLSHRDDDERMLAATLLTAKTKGALV